MKLFGFSGLGADHRVFDFLQLDYPFECIEWIPPMKNESIQSYAQRIAKYIPAQRPFGIIGVSFGGLIALEVSNILRPTFTILISSCGRRADLPFLYKIGHSTRLLPLLPRACFVPPKFLTPFFFGTKRKQLLNEIINHLDPLFAKWAVQALVSWKNSNLPENAHFIHGDKDKLFPTVPPQPHYIIHNGQHLMIVDRAIEVSAHINNITALYN